MPASGPTLSMTDAAVMQALRNQGLATPARVELRQTAAQSGVLATRMALSFDTVITQIGPTGDQPLFLAATPTIVTIRRAGWYRVSGSARLAASLIAGQRNLSIVRTPSGGAAEVLAAETSVQPTLLALMAATMLATWEGACVAGDVIQLTVDQSTGTPLATDPTNGPVRMTVAQQPTLTFS